MRPFEIFMVGLLFLGPIIAGIVRVSKLKAAERESGSRSVAAFDGASALLPLYLGVLAVVCVVHLVSEGAHWQMIPAYLAAGLVVALVSRDLGRGWRLVTATAVFVLTALTCCLAIILPVFSLPRPTGLYPIGTRIMAMTDTTRFEDAGPDRAAKRELVTQFWYPAQKSRNPRAPYRRRSETNLISSYQSVDWTHAHYDAPLAKVSGHYPVVLYNPGWNGRRTQDSFLTEELASHGYIVVAIDHPYNSGPVTLGDGRTVQAISTPELSDNTSSKATIYALIDTEVEKEAADTLFVLSQLDRINADPASPFYRRMELGKVGALGYSLGAAVAAESAYQSARIGSVVDLDTPLYGEVGRHTITQPFLFLGEDLAVTTAEEKSHMSYGQRRDIEMDEDDYARQLPSLQRPGGYQMVIKGTTHSSFQDEMLYSPLHRISNGGAIAPARMIEILRAYTLAFFDQTMRGIHSPLLDLPASPFAEVRVHYRSEEGAPPPQP